MSELSLEFIKKVANVKINDCYIHGDCRGIDVSLNNDSYTICVSSDTAGVGNCGVRLNMHYDGAFKIYLGIRKEEDLHIIEEINSEFVAEYSSTLSADKRVGITEGIDILSRIIPGANDDSTQQYAFVEMFKWWFHERCVGKTFSDGASLIHVYC